MASSLSRTGKIVCYSMLYCCPLWSSYIHSLDHLPTNFLAKIIGWQMTSSYNIIVALKAKLRKEHSKYITFIHYSKDQLETGTIKFLIELVDFPAQFGSPLFHVQS